MSETFPELPTTAWRTVRSTVVSLMAVATLVSGWVYGLAEHSELDEMTREQPAPEADWGRIASGRYTKDLERWLLSQAGPALDLESQMIALQYVLGILPEDQGAVAETPGWLFNIGHARDFDPSQQRMAKSRREFFGALGRKCRELDVRCVIAIGPDKARVYPEFLYPDGQLPPGRARFADVLREECEEAGIVFVDPIERLRDWKLRAPAETIYMRRDTHWAPTAGVAAALDLNAALGYGQAQREILQAGWQPDLSARTDLVQNARGLSDRSFLGDRIYERRDVIHPSLKRMAVGERWWLNWPSDGARVAVAGDSFAPTCVAALASMLAVPMDTRSVKPASLPEDRAAELIRRIEAGELQVDTVVLVHVERNFQRRLELLQELR